jgi:hypothetical protein
MPVEMASPSRRIPVSRWALLITALVPAFAYSNFILNHFYAQGAYFLDSGVVAGAIWRRDAWLTYAPLFPIGSLYAYHVMPLLSLFTIASRFLPIGLPGWFALITGIGQALPAIGIFWLLTGGLGLHSSRGLAIAAILAIGFAFSGIPLAIILFPHPEIFLAGGLILLCAAIAQEWYGIAAGCLMGTLLVREDAGLHAFAILFLAVMWNWYRRRPWREQRPLILLASIGLLWSVTAILFKQIVFPDQHPLFVEDYLGDPPFGNISLHLVLARLVGLPVYRAYVFWPGLAAVIWAVRSRIPSIALGYLAFCPWLLLHVLANRAIPGTLSGYYAFPFLVASAWPLAAVIIDARQRGIQPDRRTALAGFSVMLALSFLGLSKQWNPGQLDLLRNFMTPPSLARERATNRAIEVLLAGSTDSVGSTFGTIFIDQSIYSFAPYSFGVSAVAGELEDNQTTMTRPVDTLAYFESGIDHEAILEVITLAHLTHAYRFKSTSIRLASNRRLDGTSGLEAIPLGALPVK